MYFLSLFSLLMTRIFKKITFCLASKSQPNRNPSRSRPRNMRRFFGILLLSSTKVKISLFQIIEARLSKPMTTASFRLENIRQTPTYSLQANKITSNKTWLLGKRKLFQNNNKKLKNKNKIFRSFRRIPKEFAKKEPGFKNNTRRNK